MKNQYTRLSQAQKNLVCRVNKTVRRLKSQIDDGSFIKLSDKKKKQVISKLRRYINQLQRIGYKHLIACSIFGLALMMTKKSEAQVSFVKVDSVDNPLVIDTTDLPLDLILSDIDDDGDFDMMIGKFEYVTYENYYEYYSNEGSATEPLFVKQEGDDNPLNGIRAEYYGLAEIVDLDGDGDLDFIYNDYYGFFHYYKNVGDSAVPNFEKQEEAENPFSHIETGIYQKPGFVDIDGDGDLDLLTTEFEYIEGSGGSFATSFFRNTGSGTEPVFEEESISETPLAFTNEIADLGFFTFEDVDDDGDQDLLLTTYDDVSSYYFENQGSSTEADFAELTGESNPFLVIENGIDASNGTYTIPSFADLDGDGDVDFGVMRFAFGTDYYENLLNSSSVDKSSFADLEVYPTITEGQVNIRSSEEFSLVLLDVNGRVVKNYEKGTSFVNLSTFPAGIYHLKVKNKDGFDIRKVVKK